MPFNLSAGELLVVFVVALLLFGGRLPEVARALGRTLTEFKRGLSEETRRIERDISRDAEAPKGGRAEPPPGAGDDEPA
ncbi:MAG: Sec-independent protein translocase subunit TatA/TatB [Planctomycetota bacterium]